MLSVTTPFWLGTIPGSRFSCRIRSRYRLGRYTVLNRKTPPSDPTNVTGVSEPTMTFRSTVIAVASAAPVWLRSEERQARGAADLHGANAAMVESIVGDLI